MHIYGILERAARLYPGSTAVIDGNRVTTYRDIDSQVRCVAAGLAARGVAPGSRIAVLERNSQEMLVLYYAAAALGAILVPLNTRATPSELGLVLADCLPTASIVRDEYQTLFAAAAGHAGYELAPLVIGAHSYEALSAGASTFLPCTPTGDDVAHLYYTSGTTGRPKGVMLTHRNVCVHALAAIAELSLSEADVWAHVAPMFHLADAWATFALTWVGAVHVMAPRFEPVAVLELFERRRVTITNLIPTMLNLLVKAPQAAQFDTSSLRLLLSGGAPIAPEVVRSIVEVFGCEYVQTYGMTETSPYLTLSLPKRHMLSWSKERQLEVRAKTGRPFLPVELRVVDGRGQSVPADGQTVGEIHVRGETVTPGYWRRPKETADAFTDGWLMTGDLAVLDAEGYVDIVDRKKDMILSGGENVYSTEVEHALYAHPDVLEAAVFGVPDEKWGEAVRAAVVLRPGRSCTQDELVGFLRGVLAAFKVPRVVDFVEALPRTGSGKIQKSALREPHWEGRAKRV